jgi:hypothetical protein
MTVDINTVLGLYAVWLEQILIDIELYESGNRFTVTRNEQGEQIDLTHGTLADLKGQLDRVDNLIAMYGRV